MRSMYLFLAIAGLSTPAFADTDGDGYDTPADCNDYDPTIYPGGTEQCGDAEDEDCDGLLDEDWVSGDTCTYDENDGDGYSGADDCNDTDAAINPAAMEVCGDNVDNDCNGHADGYGETDIPYDGIDQDCIGGDLIDVDNDGYDYTTDCDDTNSEVNPGIDEDNDPSYSRDGVDNDCDGEIDEWDGYDDTGDTDTAGDTASDTGGLVILKGSSGCANGDLTTSGGCSTSGGTRLSLIGLIIGLISWIRRRQV